MQQPAAIGLLSAVPLYSDLRGRIANKPSPLSTRIARKATIDEMEGNAVPIDTPIHRRGVVALVLRGDKFLAIRRAAGIAAPGKYCFPGGGIEADESESAALVREIQEELGATIRPQRCIWRSTTSWGGSLAWWLGELEDCEQLVPNPAEVAAILWLTRQELLALAELLESNRLFFDAVAAGHVELGAP
jgi:8-oxo-dGTP diphosphatase